MSRLLSLINMVQLACFLFVSCCVIWTYGQQPHEDTVNQFKQQVRNKDHILEELQHQINTKDQKDLTEKELQFYYFKLHDFDNNNHLDGLEIVKALSHQHDEDEEHKADSDDEQAAHNDLTEEMITQTVDGVLEMEDKDNDGYISFAEFASFQA